jgi:hypothetical protein
MPLRRTWHRGIYRDGAAFVVCVEDDLGIAHRHRFATLTEAKNFRTGVRLEELARSAFERGPHVITGAGTN